MMQFFCVTVYLCHLLRQPFWLIQWLILKGLACLFDRRQAEPNRWFSLERSWPSRVLVAVLWRHWRSGEWHQQAGAVVCSAPACRCSAWLWSGSSNHEEPSRTGNCHQWYLSASYITAHRADVCTCVTLFQLHWWRNVLLLVLLDICSLQINRFQTLQILNFSGFHDL